MVSAGTRLPTLYHEFLVHAGRNQPILKARPVVEPRARGARRGLCLRGSRSTDRSTESDIDRASIQPEDLAVKRDCDRG